MIVVSLTNCPPKLRGDLSKWLSEINTGVYVGNMNARIREELWKRICDSIGSGQATMVFSSDNEQGFRYLTYNTSWKPYDFEGIVLMKRPLPVNHASLDNTVKHGFSKAYKNMVMGGHREKATDYVILDVETTGLDPETDRITEIAMIKVSNGSEVGRYRTYVRTDYKIPENVQKLTGITDELIEKEGVSEEEIIKPINEFICNSVVVGYNVKFDVAFVRNLLKRYNKELALKKIIDIMSIARKKIYDVSNYKMKTIADYFSLDTSGLHSAMSDCELTQRILYKLNEIK